MKVAVVGGGYAGMAAAVTLAGAGVSATVYEAGAQLGGRARRVTVNGVALDNGLHVLVGAYHETLRLIGVVHSQPQRALTRLPLDWQIHERFRLKASPLPAPLHLLAGLVTTRGAPWRERLAAARFVHAMRAQRFRLPRDMSVSALLAHCRQGASFVRYFWEPLCVAALNTPPRSASAQIFLNILRDALAASRGAGDILLARADLSTLFPEPAAEYVRSRGGAVMTGCTIEPLEQQGNAIRVRAREHAAHYDHVICAVSPHHASAVLSNLPELADIAATVARFRYQPIYSVYLQFSDDVGLPAPMLGLGGTGHWLFDRNALCGQRGLLAVVISAEGKHQYVTQDELAREIHRELELGFGPLPPLLWHRVIAEKRATFECTVGLVRPPTRTPLPNVHLAGDYTASDYPATIEAAVRSGIAAANQVLRPQL